MSDPARQSRIRILVRRRNRRVKTVYNLKKYMMKMTTKYGENFRNEMPEPPELQA